MNDEGSPLGRDSRRLARFLQSEMDGRERSRVPWTSSHSALRPDRRGCLRDQPDEIDLPAGIGLCEHVLQMGFYGGKADAQSVGGILRRSAFRYELKNFQLGGCQAVQLGQGI